MIDHFIFDILTLEVRFEIDLVYTKFKRNSIVKPTVAALSPVPL
jgi:hypothetical protein